MKKFLTLLLAALSAAVIFAFAGCAKDNRTGADGEIYGGYSLCYAFTAQDGAPCLKDYLDGLRQENKLDYKTAQGGFGCYITEVFGVGGVTVSSSAGYYAGYDWYVYTTLTSLDGVIYSTDESFIFNGLTLYKCSYGVSGLPCVKGESYALVYCYAETVF